MTQTPQLLRSGLTGRIYIVTRYKVLDAEKGRIEAITKYDVTEQATVIAQQLVADGTWPTQALEAFTRSCSKCNQRLLLTEFYRTGAQCKRCRIQAVQARYWANHDEQLAWHRAHRLEKTYGLTEQQYQDLLEAQGGVCAICHKPPPGKYRLSVDHDHDTGEIRGLLCNPCNSALGRFRDDPQLAIAAAGYLLRGRVTEQFEALAKERDSK
jgi:hypothetical protein